MLQERSQQAAAEIDRLQRQLHEASLARVRQKCAQSPCMPPSGRHSGAQLQHDVDLAEAIMTCAATTPWKWLPALRVFPEGLFTCSADMLTYMALCCCRACSRSATPPWSGCCRSGPRQRRSTRLLMLQLMQRRQKRLDPEYFHLLHFLIVLLQFVIQGTEML